MQYVWDKQKAATNLQKHHISFAEAALVFEDDYAITIEDDAASGEHVWLTLGMSDTGCLVVVWVEREADCLRIISARRATAHEKKQYIKRCTP